MSLSLVLTVGARGCAIPIGHVIETMRPLPIEPIADGPSFVLGISVIRGAPVPVVDLARLLGTVAERPPTRFVTIRVDARSVALAVEAVDGVRTVSAEAMPPLLQRADLIEAVALLDERLLFVLRAAQVIRDEVPS